MAPSCGSKLGDTILQSWARGNSATHGVQVSCWADASLPVPSMAEQGGAGAACVIAQMGRRPSTVPELTS